MTWTLLYYGLGIDSTTLVTLNEISGQQSTARTDTETKCAKLIDYLHNHPGAFVRFHASDMILYIESDAAYLVLPKRLPPHFYCPTKINASKQSWAPSFTTASASTPPSS